MTDPLPRPSGLHDRDQEWADLSEFVTSPDPGATLAFVYGRRRQGKTYLLQSLVEATGGLLFGGLQMTEAQNLARFAETYGQFRGLSPGTTRLPTWDAAIDAAFTLGEDAALPVVVVLDEFPYLLESAPGLPSVIQSALSPRGRARTRSRTRLVLCGSALTIMRGLLTGGAPLRGRAVKELVIHPFGFRETANFWGIDDLDTAFRVHALVGGTPAYLDMCGGAPAGPRAFDRWVARALLGPGSAMFREGSVLVQAEVTDPAPYHSMLSAIVDGAHRRSEIAAIVRRPDSALSHPLAVLERVQLVERVPDALQPRRSVYHVAEPVIRLHQLLIRRNEAALVARHGPAVWESAADTVAAKIYGPHLEHLARLWCLLHASPATLGGRPNQVGPATIPCREHRQGHEIDVVVSSAPEFEPERVLAIGQAKASTKPVDVAELARLDHLRQLLPAGRVTTPPRLLLFGRSGFTTRLHQAAATRPDVGLIDLTRLYQGT